MKLVIKLILFLFIHSSLAQLPDGFVYVKDVVPDIEIELRYCSNHNFVGSEIDGYSEDKLILTKQAALALKQVQDELKENNLRLKVFDGYRPQTAVNHFIRWAKNLSDTVNKPIYYPDVKKSDLFKEEYIAARSGHSKGSTVDLTIVDSVTGKQLDMGSIFDFFGVESWVNYDKINQKQKANRQLLQEIMSKHGFKNYPREWWHFTLKEEPFPATYFDFPIR